MTLDIDGKHRLVGPQVVWQPTPNVGGRLAARVLVMHYTAGSSAASAITSLCTRKPSGNCSAHLVLARDGTITQLAGFDVVTWHAGVSEWNGIVGLNQASIGIEIDNAGALNQIGSRFMTWFGREVSESEVLMAAHKHGGPVRPWHAYTALQIERCLELAELLVQRYGLAAVIGHEDIAPGRKSDPGPAFPLAAVAARALGREDDAPAACVVTVAGLNIRQAPDPSAPTVAPPLAKGTRVRVLEVGSRWSRVELDAARDVEGWVHNRFLEPAREAPAAARGRPSARTPSRNKGAPGAKRSAPRKGSARTKTPRAAPRTTAQPRATPKKTGARTTAAKKTAARKTRRAAPRR